MKKSFPIY